MKGEDHPSPVSVGRAKNPSATDVIFDNSDFNSSRSSHPFPSTQEAADDGYVAVDNKDNDDDGVAKYIGGDATVVTMDDDDECSDRLIGSDDARPSATEGRNNNRISTIVMTGEFGKQQKSVLEM